MKKKAVSTSARPQGRNIKALYPVTGDWFLVTEHRWDKKSRWFIERIVLWGVVATAEFGERMVAFGSEGMPSTETVADRFDEAQFVNGLDRISPQGITWSEVYETATRLGGPVYGRREFQIPSELDK